MTIIITENQLSKLDKFLFNFFDGTFKKYDVENDGEGYVRFINSDETSVYSKNVWGMFWVYDCEEWSKISKYRKHIGEEMFDEMLINYLNKTFSDKFVGGNLIRKINTNQC